MHRRDGEVAAVLDDLVRHESKRAAFDRPPPQQKPDEKKMVIHSTCEGVVDGVPIVLRLLA